MNNLNILSALLLVNACFAVRFGELAKDARLLKEVVEIHAKSNVRQRRKLSMAMAMGPKGHYAEEEYGEEEYGEEEWPEEGWPEETVGKGKGGGYRSKKGMMMMAMMPSKGKGKGAEAWDDEYGGADTVWSGGAPACVPMRVLGNLTEILAGEEFTAVGSSFTFPLYNPDTMEEIGRFTDSSTQLANEECEFTGDFSFDLVEDGDSVSNPFFGNYASQVAIAGTCSGAYNSVTGGYGAYGCQTGYMGLIPAPSEEFVLAEIFLCNPNPCPLMAMEGAPESPVKDGM